MIFFFLLIKIILRLLELLLDQEASAIRGLLALQFNWGLERLCQRLLWLDQFFILTIEKSQDQLNDTGFPIHIDIGDLYGVAYIEKNNWDSELKRTLPLVEFLGQGVELPIKIL